MAKNQNSRKSPSLYSKLKDLEAKHQDLDITLHSIGDAVIVTDSQGFITKMNPAAENLTGWSFEECQDKYLPEIFKIYSTTTGKSAEDPVHKVLKTGKVQGLSNDTMLMQKDGSKIQIADSASPIYNKENQINGVVLVFRDVTEEYLNKLALKESEENFRILAETSPMAILLYQNDKFIYANKAAEEISGYTLSDFLQMSFWDLVHPDFKELVKKRGQARQKGKKAPAYEFKIITKQGEEKWVHLTGNTVEFQGKGAGLIIVLDITKRKSIGERLKASEEKYRNILESMEEGYFELDLAGNFTFFNPSISTLLGYPEEELIGLNNRNYTTKETAKKMFKIFNQIYTTGRAAKITDYEVFTKHGDKRILEVSARLKHDHQENPIGFSGIARDVTAKRQAEQDLVQSESTYRAIFENTGTATVILEQDNTISMANKEFEKISGFDKIELEGKKKFSDFILVSELEKMQKVKDQVGPKLQEKDSPPQKYEFRFLDREGNVKNVLCTIDIIPNTLKSVASLLDDTERRRTQEKQRKLEAQLLQSQKMEAIGTLAGGIAHDFNNILQGISGNVQLMLKKHSYDNKINKYPLEIKKLTDRASELIKGLLTFSRRSEPQLTAQSLNKIIKDSVFILKHTIPKMISIETNLNAKQDQVKADPIQMQQVFMNLVSNARDAISQEEGGKIIISTEQVELDEEKLKQFNKKGSGAYLQITVSDNGSGIDPKIVPHIFEPFFSTKEVGQGTGLGLATVYGILESHSGIIECRSQLQEGTTFTLFLPSYNEKNNNDSIATKQAQNDYSASTNQTILIVEDEDIVLQVTTESLESNGFKVLTATSGEQALQIFKEKHNQIDLVILDIGMPGIGGEQTLEKLLQINPLTKVIIVSGYSSHDIAKAPEKYGAHDFLCKPYRLESLLQKICLVLNKKN